MFVGPLIQMAVATPALALPPIAMLALTLAERRIWILVAILALEQWQIAVVQAL